MRDINKRDSVQYNKGEILIAFVFACPGQKEVQNKKVVFGQTGYNLDLLLKELKIRCPDKFKSTNRYDYLLTNASEKVYYKGYFGNRTLPYYKDVYYANNLMRLKNELGTMQYIISFGGHARKALKKAGINAINSMYHLGMQGINHIRKDIAGNTITKEAQNATEKRIEVIALDLLNKIN